MPVTLQRTSTPQPGTPADFYAPRFEIEVDGETVGPESLGSVHEVSVQMALDSPTHFELVLDNWDDRRAHFKNIESAGKQTRPLFGFGRHVLIRMGYADRLVPMVLGPITALAPHFPESGARTLTVSGLDRTFDLTGAMEPKKYSNMTDWEIAQEIAAHYDFSGVRVTKEGPKNELVMKRGQNDADFLRTRAQRIGFEFYIRTGPGKDEKDTLFFVKPESIETSKAPVYVFEWGKNLLSFDPMVDISKQVSEVVVLSSNSQAKDRPLKGLARPADLPSGGGRNGAAVSEKVQQGRQKRVENAQVANEEEARQMAINMLRDLAYAYSTGSGKVIGLPELRPRDLVQIEGVGLRFGGSYQVTRVEHTINDSGYLTTFSVRRVHDGGTRS